MKAFRFAADLERDPPEVATLWRAGCRGMQQDGAEVVAWFDDEVDLAPDLGIDGAWSEADDTDWLGAYYAGLQPVSVGSLVVAPTHLEVTVAAPQRLLWLDPGTAFGTGHHETTRMALAALQRSSLAGTRVLDVGAGSGILAIAADLLGADSAVGVDTDAATVPVARANAALNLSRARFRVGTLDDVLDDGPDEGTGDGRGAGRADVVVANLFAELHARLFPSYLRALAPRGRLVLTGILREREAGVAHAVPPSLRQLERREEGGWVLIVLERR